MDLLAEYVGGVWRHKYLAAGIGLVMVCYSAMRMYLRKVVCLSKAKLTGKTVIITGANTGIGLEVAVDLAKRGARVILACRDGAKGKVAEADVRQRSKSNADAVFSQLDLASLQSVREFSMRILEEEPRIDILINNAGVVMPPYSTTKEGFELQFGVNHLGHFLLTNLLMERIKKAPAGRIVNVSSQTLEYGKINFADLNSKQSYSRWGCYFQSKLANFLFTKSLAKRLRGTSTTAYVLHPGRIATEGNRHLVPTQMNFLVRLLFKTPWQGAQTTIHCAVTEGIEGESGKYFSNCKVTEVTNPEANDDAIAERLWAVSTQLVGLEIND